MEDRQQWLSLAAVVLVIVGLGFFLYRQSRQEPEAEVSENTENTIDQQTKDLAENFNVDLNDDSEKASLKDISDSGGNGIAVRKYQDDQFSSSVLAALPDPEPGSFYEAYMVKGDGDDQEVMWMGKLTGAKGGWMLDFLNADDKSEYKRIRVTREKVDDRKPEETVLEGSF